MGARQKSAKEKLRMLVHYAGLKDATLKDVTRYLTKKGRKK